ncbi:hypothetical protein PLESTM_002070600 [Pleodorina starrii]|nr:hypothetical protein PLESTM_002070600 [Pleodorina starrii]
MSECHNNMNGADEASWEVSAPQGCGFPSNNADAAASDARQQTGANLSFAPLLATPSHLSTGPEGRADFLRRALTSSSPWRLLAPRRAPHGGPAGALRGGGAERSCHAAIGNVTAVISAGPTIGDISAPGRCRSSASIASQRSLFTVDGLPEPLAPDPSVLNLTTHAHPSSYATAAGDGSGSRRGGGRPLQHAATTLGVIGPARRQSAQQYHTQVQTQVQTQAQERSWHRLAGRGSSLVGPSAQNGLPYAYETESGPTEAGSRPQAPHPQPNPQHAYTHAHAHLLQTPPQQPRQQEVPPPTWGTSAAPTGFQGSMHHHHHHYLQLPGGPDTSARPNPLHQTAAAAAGAAAIGAHPPPAACAGTATASSAAAEPLLALQADRSAGVAASPAAAAAALAGSSQLHWDDARNPMSFNYDPSLHPYPHHQQHPQQPPPPAQSGAPQQQQQRTELPYGLHSRQGDVSNGGLVPPGQADAGGDGAEVVASDGSFVVLQMKGPRGTPSTHAGAAAAFVSGASASPAAPDAAAAAAGMSLTLRGRVSSYFSKWVGVGDTLMPSDQPVDIAWSWVGAFMSILVVAALNEFLTPHVSLPLMIASFGASAVLLFGVPASKLAQPRNFLGGQVVSSLVGVLVRLAFMHAPHLVWLSAALGMSTALAVMQLTRTVHPPGGASALIAASAPYIGPWYGFKFLLTVFFGSVAMLVVALGINNLSARRRYPTYWMGK